MQTSKVVTGLILIGIAGIAYIIGQANIALCSETLGLFITALFADVEETCKSVYIAQIIILIIFLVGVGFTIHGVASKDEWKCNKCNNILSDEDLTKNRCSICNNNITKKS